MFQMPVLDKEQMRCWKLNGDEMLETNSASVFPFAQNWLSDFEDNAMGKLKLDRAVYVELMIR